MSLRDGKDVSNADQEEDDREDNNKIPYSRPNPPLPLDQLIDRSRSIQDKQQDDECPKYTPVSHYFSGYGLHHGVFITKEKLGSLERFLCYWDDHSMATLKESMFKKAVERAKIGGWEGWGERTEEMMNGTYTEESEVFDNDERGVGEPVTGNGDSSPPRKKLLNYEWKEGNWRYIFREGDIDTTLEFDFVMKVREVSSNESSSVQDAQH